MTQETSTQDGFYVDFKPYGRFTQIIVHKSANAKGVLAAIAAVLYAHDLTLVEARVRTSSSEKVENYFHVDGPEDFPADGEEEAIEAEMRQLILQGGSITGYMAEKKKHFESLTEMQGKVSHNIEWRRIDDDEYTEVEITSEFVRPGRLFQVSYFFYLSGLDVVWAEMKSGDTNRFLGMGLRNDEKKGLPQSEVDYLDKELHQIL